MSAVGSSYFTDVGAEKTCFRCRKWSRKGTQSNRNGCKRKPTEPRKLERHPCGTISKKYRSKMPKGSVRASSFGIVFDQNQLKSKQKNIKQIIQKSVTEKHEKWYQNYGKREPTNIECSILLRKVTLRSCVFYHSKTQKFEDETSTFIKHIRKTRMKTISEIECKTLSKKHSSWW